LTWATKQHFVQRPTPYDALESLSGYEDHSRQALIPQKIKAIEFEDMTSGSGKGQDNSNSDSSTKVVFSRIFTREPFEETRF
jgi:hypothetical protein